MLSSGVLYLLTCVDELNLKILTLKQFLKQTAKNGTSNAPYLIRMLFHDAVDFNNLTTDGTSLNGIASGIDFCLHNPASVSNNGSPNPGGNLAHNRGLNIPIRFIKSIARTKAFNIKYTISTPDLLVLSAITAVHKLNWTDSSSLGQINIDLK